MANESSVQQYWKVYGGIWSLLRSAYFWLAIVFSLLGVDIWWVSDEKTTPRWLNFSLDVTPSVLGFSLGGMAILLAFSTDRFLYAIKQGGKEDSYFMKVMASFFHLAIVQVVGLLAAIFCVPVVIPYCIYAIISFIGFFATVYGLLLIISTVATLWHTGRIFNRVDVSRPNSPTDARP